MKLKKFTDNFTEKFTTYKYSFAYWHAFMIPFIVMVAGCIGNGIFPFGARSFLRNDLYNQYVQFFTELHDKIWQGEGLTYSFELGLGSGFAALYGYYLASPVNWLMVLCPRGLIAEFITVVILIKTGLAGMSFAHYLRKHFGREDMGILLFSSAYALSGFMAAYQWNIMWLDVVVLAPLVILAMEELIETGKGSKYCILLACSILTNFYLSIMMCIFLVLYFLAIIVWKPWRVKWRSCFIFGWYSLLAGGMACGLLLPVYFALSGTEFHEFDFPDKVKWYMNFLEELSRHCMNVSMKVQADHWPNVYCGVVMFLLIPLFSLNRRIFWKDKVAKLILAAVFLVGFACNILDFIWHGLNYPDSLPGRQSYLYIWLLLVMGYEVYINLRAVRLWQLILSAVFGYGVVISAWIFTDVEGTDTWTYVLTLVFMTLYFGLFVGRYLWNYPRVRAYLAQAKGRVMWVNRCLGVKVLLLLLVVVELASNMYLTSIRTVNRTSFMKHYRDIEGAADWMKDYDDDLYRTEIFERITKNDGMMWGINSTTIFSSTASAGIVDFYKSMGLGTTRVSYWYQGATPLVSALLGVRYMVGKDDSMDNDLYDVIYSDETGYLYKCNYSLPMGYVVRPELEDKWNLEVYNPVKAQNKFCQLLGANGDLLVPLDSTKVDDQTYTITVPQDSYVYVYLGNNALSEVKYTNGEKAETFTQVSFDYLLDLGFVAAGEEPELKVKEEDQKFKTFKAYYLNERVLKEAIAILSEHTLAITEHRDGYVKGSVSLEEAGKLVLAVPMEKGWTLRVNGEERPLESFKDAFVAVSLEAGDYDVELTFATPGVKPGMVISAVCIVLWLLCFWKEKSLKRYGLE